MSRKTGPYRANNPDRPLTPREKKVIAARARGFSQKKALAMAGYKPGSSGQVLSRPLVQSALTVALAKQGASLGKLVKPIADALKANLHSSFMGVLRKSDLPDHKTRLEAAELGISLHGGLPKQVELPPAPQEPLTVIFESEGRARAVVQVSRAPLTTRERVQAAQDESLELVLEDAKTPD